MEIITRLQTMFTTGWTWWYVLDIIIMIFVTYCVMAFLRRHQLLPLLKYLIIAVTLIAVVMCFAGSVVVSAVLASALVSSLIVSAVVIFRNDFRRGLFKLASPRKEADHYNAHFSCSDEELATAINEMTRGCIALAKNNIGALIILQHDNMPEHVIDSGTRLGAIVSAPLLECLFNIKAPLHDGAVVIQGNKIVAAGCFLPLTQSLSLPKELGTRHRAGVGITEVADVLAIIVSEETGVISVAKNGNINRYQDASLLTQTMEQFYGLKVAQVTTRSRRRIG